MIRTPSSGPTVSVENLLNKPSFIAETCGVLFAKPSQVTVTLGRIRTGDLKEQCRRFTLPLPFGKPGPRASFPSPRVAWAIRVPESPLLRPPPPVPQRVRFVAYAIGLLLVCTAALKAYGLNLATYPQFGRLLGPPIQAAIVTWELILALWLVTQAGRFAPWLATLLTFAAFTCASGYLIAVGQADCQCFGVVRTSPWVAFAVDVVIVTGLIAARPKRPGSWSAAAEGTRWPAASVSALILLALTCWALFGSFGATAAQLRGQRVGADYSHVDFGSGSPDVWLEAPLSVFNRGDRPVRLIGIVSQCSCLTTQDLPLTLAPRGRTELRLILTVPRTGPGYLARRLELLTDDASQPRIRITVGCMVQ